jgi:hypothetical protein
LEEREGVREDIPASTTFEARPLRASPKVFQENVHALAVRSIVLDHYTTASYNLARVTILVNLAKSSPGSKELGVADLWERRKGNLARGDRR